MTNTLSRLPIALLTACLMLLVGTAHAHFLWLKSIEVDGAPQAFLHFGESPVDEAYHFPDKMAGAKIWRRDASGKREELATEKLETDERVGIVAKLPSEEACVLETTQPYGVYEDWLLTYYAKHVLAPSNEALAQGGPSKELALDIIPEADGEDLKLTVLSAGQPLADAELTVMIGDDEPFETKTNSEGVAAFTPASAGLVAVLANHRDKSKSGKVGDKQYNVAVNYASLTFPWREADAPSATSSSASDEPSAKADSAPAASRFPPLPEAVASFGAVVDGGWLYVYSGHTGTEHDHSAENLSHHFVRLKLDGGDAWENLPMSTPLQGLPLVAHDGKIYRVGGLSARNTTTDDKEDLHSSAEFAVFDPATDKWTSLTPLPEGRSSHNAAVIGDKLYVVGGWRLTGSSKGDWQTDTLVFDFNDPDAGWQKLPQPPFKRRAIAASQLDGKLVVLGGMNENAKVAREVFLFDPATGKWSEGPKIPGAGMAGFGVSAWNLDGKLYVSGFRGVVYRLNDAGSEWEEAARLASPRFFHQLVPAGDGGLLAVGGASSDGHLADIEWLDVTAAAPTANKDDQQSASAESEGDESPTAEPAAATSTGAAAPAVSDVDLVLRSPACPANIWPGFRGLGNSVTAARDLPTAWSDEQGIAWTAKLPGYGQSSPVVYDGRIYITTMQGDNKETPTVLCYLLATGEKLWQREFTSSQPIKASNFTTRSSPTPVVDDTGVFCFFESGELIALDHQGNTRWQRSLVNEYGKFESEFGIGSSLAQTNGAIFVLVNQSTPSYLMAVDKRTGENVWKIDYPGRVAWSTPLIHHVHNRDLVVVSAAGIVEAYDATTGSRLWQLDGFAENNIPSPTPAGEFLFIGSPDVSSNVALRLTTDSSEPRSAEAADVAQASNQSPESSPHPAPQIVWRSDAASSNFSSPLFYDGLVYMVNRAGVAFCLDARTGQVVWKHRLPDTCWASPLAAGELLFFFTKGGKTVVARPGREWNALAENSLPIDPNTRIYGIAPVAGALIVRTGTQLFCLGSPSGV